MAKLSLETILNPYPSKLPTRRNRFSVAHMDLLEVLEVTTNPTIHTTLVDLTVAAGEVLHSGKEATAEDMEVVCEVEDVAEEEDVAAGEAEAEVDMAEALHNTEEVSRATTHTTVVVDKEEHTIIRMETKEEVLTETTIMDSSNNGKRSVAVALDFFKNHQKKT